MEHQNEPQPLDHESTNLPSPCLDDTQRLSNAYQQQIRDILAMLDAEDDALSGATCTLDVPNTPVNSAQAAEVDQKENSKISKFLTRVRGKK